jgi:hypothetical protein
MNVTLEGSQLLTIIGGTFTLIVFIATIVWGIGVLLRGMDSRLAALSTDLKTQVSKMEVEIRSLIADMRNGQTELSGKVEHLNALQANLQNENIRLRNRVDHINTQVAILASVTDAPIPRASEKP